MKDLSATLYQFRMQSILCVAVKQNCSSCCANCN